MIGWVIYWLLALIAMFAVRLMPQEEIRCSLGEYASDDTCNPCPLHSFMSDENHEHTSCWSCSYPKPGSHEIILQACTSTADSKLGCENGYYRSGKICEACTDCDSRNEFKVLKCEHTTDTVCCPEPDMAVQTAADGSLQCVTNQARRKILVKCRKGHYFSFSDLEIPSCVPCVEGTFISEDFHSMRKCRRCTKVEKGSHETVVESCTSTTDTVISCERGYYRYEDHSELKGSCRPCSQCGPDQPYETHPCGTNSDTVCCSNDNMEVGEYTKGSFTCVPKPRLVRGISALCDAGQYLEYEKSGLEHCRPCKIGTFMPVGNHANTACKRCTKASALLNEVEISKCTSTKDAVIICKQGYYLNDQGNEITSNSLRSRHIYGGCERCSVCTCDSLNMYEGRQCTYKTNTVCCPEPGMIVTTDDNGKHQCVTSTSLAEVIFQCGKGHFLKQNSADKPSCKQCPKGTFMPLDNHSYIDCKYCAQADDFLNEIEAKPCTTTSDTVIMCNDGHYREESEDPLMMSGTCNPCTRCESYPKDKYLGRKCEGYDDTVCCPEKDMEVEKNENGKFVCKFSPDHNSKSRNRSTSNIMDQRRNGRCFFSEYPLVRISKTDDVICRRCPELVNTTETAIITAFCLNTVDADISKVLKGVERLERCRAGEYMYLLDLIPEKNEVLCMKCKNGTYMKEDYHRRTECKSCTIDTSKTITKNCTITSDTQFVKSSTSFTRGSQQVITVIGSFLAAILMV